MMDPRTSVKIYQAAMVSPPAGVWHAGDIALSTDQRSGAEPGMVSGIL